MNGDFSSSPQDYHRAWRNRVGAGKSFLGPWNYAGESPGSDVKKRFQGPQNKIGVGSYKQPRGFVSPVSGYSGPKRKRKSYNFGDNRTQALSEE